jgi:hypothetical protein
MDRRSEFQGLVRTYLDSLYNYALVLTRRAEDAEDLLQESLVRAYQGFEQVKMGDLLFHGDGATEKKLSVTLSKTGMACAMCHPFASDNHPHEFPKFQEQINKFATLRDMINWCIEKPNEGVKIDPDSDAMKALEAYIYWSNKGSKLDAGRH